MTKRRFAKHGKPANWDGVFADLKGDWRGVTRYVLRLAGANGVLARYKIYIMTFWAETQNHFLNCPSCTVCPQVGAAGDA
jgi:hypothetical protein